MYFVNYSLEAMSRAFACLPALPYKTIHVAGTNGKGSVCTFLELLYLNCLPDIKVGKYISPHIWQETERFSVNGVEISEERLGAVRVDVSASLRGAPEAQQSHLTLTEFELQTMIALEYFREEQVDVAILEVGLGGRLDATNIIPAELRLATAITNIGFDHMDYLGDTLEKIRYEKEGIKREGVKHFEPGLKIDDQSAVIASHEAKQSPNSINGSNFLLALEIFETINNLKVTGEQKLKVLEQFPLRYKGRFDYKDGILIDGAHNPDGMRVLNAFIRSLPEEFTRKIFVLAFLDKDYKSALEELFASGVLDADKDLVIITELDSERSTPAFLLDEVIDANKLIISDPREAIAKAKELKGLNDLVVIAGSLKLIRLV